MTTDTRPFEEMNAIAKQIKEQALVATDDYFKFLKKTISSHPARGSEVGDVLKSNAQRNIELVQEYVHKFSEAKDFSDALRVQPSTCSHNSLYLGSKQKLSVRHAASQL